MLRDTAGEKDERDPSHSINNAIGGHSASFPVFCKAKHKGSDTNEWRVIQPPPLCFAQQNIGEVSQSDGGVRKHNQNNSG